MVLHGPCWSARSVGGNQAAAPEERQSQLNIYIGGEEAFNPETMAEISDPGPAGHWPIDIPTAPDGLVTKIFPHVRVRPDGRCHLEK